MLEQTLAIVRNTFFESIRQPVMLVILVVGSIAIVLSNPLSAFTMEDDHRMLIDIGLATVFLCGTILASFIATSVLTQEIDNRTALTVVSKPVGRPLFILGKYLGVAAALLVGTLLLGLVFLLTEMQAVRQTVRTPLNLPVIYFGYGAGIVGVLVGVWCNYFYNKVFASSVICAVTPLLAVAYVLSLLFDPDFNTQSPAVAFKGHLWLALTTMTVGIMVLASIAVAASTRLGQVMTLGVTLGAFLLGMLSDWFFGRRLEAIYNLWTRRGRAEGWTETEEVTRYISLISGEVSEPITREVEYLTVPVTRVAEFGELIQYGFFWVCYAVLPNFQTMLLMDAITQDHVIPVSYVVSTAIYGLFYIVAALALATILFQRREVG